MYRIVICDDEIFFCNHIEKLLRKYTESLADDMDIQIYTSSDAFLEDIGKSADLYFLDIKMPGNCTPQQVILLFLQFQFIMWRPPATT